MARYGEVLESDLLRYYGVDLLDLHRGTLSPRRVMVLVAGLPPGCGFHRLRGGPAAWSDEVTAIHQEGGALRRTLVDVMGGKPLPKAAEPPEVGWREKQAEADARQAARVRRLKARTKN